MVFGSRRVAAAMMGFAMAASAPASAQLFWKTPDFRGAPVQGTEPGVMIPLPGATRAELNAEIVWTVRAGLNFAALQCQFAPSLMTVDTYKRADHASQQGAGDRLQAAADLFQAHRRQGHQPERDRGRVRQL